MIIRSSKVVLPVTYGAMRSSGLETINLQIMINDIKMQKLQITTEPAISYSTCYVSVIFLAIFLLCVLKNFFNF